MSRLRELSVLLAEDEVMSAKLMRMWLEPYVREIYMACDGQEGLFAFASKRPDIVITDLSMPKMDGIQMTQAIHQVSPETPVLVVTALEDLEEIKKAISVGVQGYLTKPATPEALFRALAPIAEHLCAGKEVQRQRTLNDLMRESIPFPAVLIDAQARAVVASNKPAADLGYEPGKPFGEPFFSESMWRTFLVNEEDALALPELGGSREVNAFNRNWVLHWTVTGAHLIFVVAVDITQRKRAEESLRIFEFMANASDQLMSLINRYHVYEGANDAYCALRGLRRSQLVGRTVSEIWGEETYRIRIKPKLDHCFEGEKVTYEETFHLLDGSKREMIVAYTPYRDPHGEITHVVSVAFDITERKKLERLREDVERMTRHDLKTPLNHMIAIPQLLLEGDLTQEENRSFLLMLKESAYQMLDMLNMSFTLFKIETGAYVLAPTPVEILRIIRRVQSQLEDRLNSKSLTLALTCDGEPLCADRTFIVRGEELLCYSLLSNLIVNAVEASPRGESIGIDLEKGAGVRIRIRNKGTVPVEIRDRFFEKYVTAGKARGTGLGAYIALRIANTLDGSLRMETSDERNETCLTIALPILL